MRTPPSTSPRPTSPRRPALRYRLTAALAVGATAALTAGSLAGPALAQTPPIELTPLGAFDSGVGEGGAEIVAYSPRGHRMYITNGAENRIDIVDISDPDDPTLVRSVDMSAFGDGIQSVAVGRGGLVAAAVKAADGTRRGNVVTFDRNGRDPQGYRVGVLPDAIAFTPDGRYIVVADEGEPVCDGEDLVGDPVGSVSIVDTERNRVRTAGFERWNGREDALRARGIRIFFPGSNAAQDIEPEYVAISPSGRVAYVTLQENNAIAVVNIANARVERIIALGTKDHSLRGNGFDASNEDAGIAIRRWDVQGMYLPDAIAVVPADRPRDELLVTANEGDARDYDCFSEDTRIGDFGLADPYPASADADDALGRLKTTSAFPTTFDDGGEIEQAYAYGARSFTIWDRRGEVVFDSGDEIERITAAEVPTLFNADSGDPAEFDERSDDKGPEPEGLTLGVIDGRRYAFVLLERTGGVMVFDVTRPERSSVVTYVNTTEMGDISPEGVTFVGAAQSPTGDPLLLVSHELSGTTRVFSITPG